MWYEEAKEWKEGLKKMDEEKEIIYLIPFKEDRMICPECMKIYPKLRLPLLTVCMDCPNEETRRKNLEFNSNLKNSKPKNKFNV